jgi:polar amino acid transport system substrate-binding protein
VIRSTPRALTLLSMIVVAALLASCAGAGSGGTASQSASSSASSGPSAEACATDDLATKEAGVFTVGTDNPAFPPYFAEPKGDQKATDPWEFGDPTNGRGFESAMAYALAEQLGFTDDQVKWVPVPFNSSIAPGAKDFDVYLAQVSFTEERTQAVDLSEGYFFSNQALVTTAGSDLADATSIAEVAQFQLGAAGNTTSLTYIQDKIQPTKEPRVYDDNTAAKAAIEAGQVEGVVFDLATAFYIVNVEMDDGVVVGQFPSDPADKEHFSFVLDLDSPLTDCVDEAILTMGENGELDTIAEKWLADFLDAPSISE